MIPFIKQMLENNNFKMLIIYILLISLLHYTQCLQCMDENKNPVDWYIIYKLPQEKHSNKLINDGVAFTYMTSNDLTGWKFSDVSLNETRSIVGVTLEPLFTKRNDILYLLYNDENPDGSVNFRKGHTKGTILGDANGGIWLIHSVPRFPRVDSASYYYPSNGLPYGQSFLCISLNIENLDNVGTQLKHNLPNIYFHHMPDKFKWMFPKLLDVMNNNVNDKPPWYNAMNLTSLGGVPFISFAKGPRFPKELYLDWIAPTLNVNLYAETWPNSPGRIPSECDIHYKVYNVKTVSLSVANITFKNTVDHSKWAVVSKDNPNEKWICIGDINRNTAQRQRGGGTVCFSMGIVSKGYQKSVEEIEPC
ncbi:hypothetical protein FQA39_LY00488 [Lamprigera yunnana]|nr:hypothetical protein FQA39_LY00488 [Lamprigera yunnana]